MNIYQRIILILGAGSLILILLTAPKYVVLEGNKIDYSIILNKLENAKENPPETYQDKLAIAKMSINSPSVDLPKTCLRLAVVVVVTVLLCFAFNKLGNPHIKLPIVRFFKWISFSFVRLFYFFRIHKRIFISLIAVFIIVIVLIFVPLEKTMQRFVPLSEQVLPVKKTLNWLNEDQLNYIYDIRRKAARSADYNIVQETDRNIVHALSKYFASDPNMLNLISSWEKRKARPSDIVDVLLNVMHPYITKTTEAPQELSLWQCIAQRGAAEFETTANVEASNTIEKVVIPNERQ